MVKKKARFLHSVKTDLCVCIICFIQWYFTYTHTPSGEKQTIDTSVCTHVCIYSCIHMFFPHSLFFSILGELYSRKGKKNHCPLSNMYTFYPCNMSQMILWLNPGKNVKNAWLDTCFSRKNTTLLINCSTWKSLFDMMYIFVSAWDEILFGAKLSLAWRERWTDSPSWAPRPSGTRSPRWRKTNPPVPPLSGFVRLSTDWPWSWEAC